MSFTSHIDFVTKKMSKNTGILYKIKDLLPLRTRLDYYFAFIYPYLTYNVLVWGAAYQYHLTTLITQHKRTIRTIANSGYLDHTNPLFIKLGLLKFQDIYKFNLLVYMHSARKRGEYGRHHDVNTRNRNSALPKRPRLTLFKHAVSYAGPSHWNQLPNELQAIPRLDKFKTALKKYFLDQYVSNN